MKHRNRIIAVALFVAVSAVAFLALQRKPETATPVRASQPSATTAIAVSVEPAAVASVRDSLSLVALVEAWRDVDLHAETSGIVRSVSSEVGQKMAAGQPLFKVDDEVAASALRKARVNRELARRDFERYSSLLKEGAVAASSAEAMRLKLEDAEADLVSARRRVEDTAIKAPFAGVVTSRLVEVGDLVQPGMKVANMVDLSKLKIVSSLPEKQVSLIAEGMPVQVTTDVWPGKEFLAKVLSVSAKSSRDHTYRVESVMENPKETPFRAGMFARSAFVGGSSREALLIPRRALTGSIAAPEVFVVSGGRARLKKIVAGGEYGTRVEVLQGLAAGDRVVVSGQSDLDDGSPVTVSQGEAGR
ncbi:efflux RND transporter periplasmic adaptor subunit [Chlorobaculum thiosulfatiphilum]|uniref:Efflux RND transporter periplasmic adaptor subunit n=1 Tax=Chlorobaculum thiosulfatiphilum TaxID=115852 RepID=A0A5C4SC57_CHLTI|nr:efflux RND transporter periplasmic adaptor subunit [Chlorobaculum thiosulfatiphilum]TNJ40361.1 efflux RND transporter periplasmic adaptor subunit [Chlorobaculum thiosulfatiphilum]